MTELRYADDTALFCTIPGCLNNRVQPVNIYNAAYRLSINAANIKILDLDKWQENTNIVIDNINVERVQSFLYLGTMFTTNLDGASNINAVGDGSRAYLRKSASKELNLKVIANMYIPNCYIWV